MTETQEPEKQPSLLVVDIAKKQPKKRVKQLRKGQGKLLEKISDAVGELKAGGSLGPEQTVVVVVREECTRPMLRLFQS